VPVKVGVEVEITLPSAGRVRVTSSGVVSALVIVQEALAAGPLLPAWSVALTRKVWLAGARPVYDCGLVQGVKPLPSRLQAKLAPGSLLVNVMLALVCVVGSDGPEPIVAVGAVVSTVNVFALLVPVLPA
jgi:hypothetical protein